MNRARILVVDDELDMLRICSRALSRAGYTVFEASTAEQARRHLDHENLDLVILDIHMPDEDGISLLKHAHQVNPALPAMLITGWAATNTVIDSIRLNVKEYLCKPFTMPRFLKAVKASLGDLEQVGEISDP